MNEKKLPIDLQLLQVSMPNKKHNIKNQNEIIKIDEFTEAPH